MHDHHTQHSLITVSAFTETPYKRNSRTQERSVPDRGLQPILRNLESHDNYFCSALFRGYSRQKGLRNRPRFRIHLDISIPPVAYVQFWRTSNTKVLLHQTRDHPELFRKRPKEKIQLLSGRRRLRHGSRAMECTCEWMNEWQSGRTDEWVTEWTNGWIGARVDGWRSNTHERGPI